MPGTGTEIVAVDLSVVVPVYRNAATVGELSRRIRQTCLEHELSVEIVFVDDACPEGSLVTLRGLAAEDDRIRVIALERNVGQNRAVVAGLAQVRGRAAVIMDADLQDPPEAIPRLLAALGDSPVVFAGRRGLYQSRWRMLTSRVFKRLLWVVSRMRVPPDAGLFVALRREAVESLLALDDPDPYVIALIARTGGAVTSVPVPRAHREDGRSSYDGAERARVARRALASMWRPGRTNG
jgi:polyisoprenyl-phosphate glycosyltransferase